MNNAPPITEPAPDFDDALAVLRGYHRVMLDLCDSLKELSRQVEFDKKGSDFNTITRTVYHYFVVATELHHRDEEQALFPQLVSSSSTLMAPMMERLEEDHVEIEQVWNFLAPLLMSPETIDNSGNFCKAAHRFAQLLQWHIEREEDNFFPEVEKILSMEQRCAIGAEMAKHRSLLVST